MERERTPAASKAEKGDDWRAEVGAETNSGRSVDLARAREPERGREADTPEEIPARGWRDVLLRDARWRWVTWGSILGALLWIAASLLFSWYVATFDSYNATYGSLGAGVGFMVWLWLSAVIVLLGGELNAEMEHQTAHDTTEGGSKPLGSRGAMMADHVGEAQV